MLIETEPAPAGAAQPAHWTQRRSVGPTPDGPWRLSVEQHWILTPEGHAAVADEINQDEQVELVYDPPLVMLPAALEPDLSGDDAHSFVQTLRMRVHPLGNRRAIKASGTARQVITHQGAAMVGTPAGERAAQHILLSFTAALKPAEVTNLTNQWLDLNDGLIAEQREERTRVLGVPTRHNRESWVVDDQPR